MATPETEIEHRQAMSLRFLGGTIIELSDELIVKAREGLKAHPDVENQAEVVFLLNDTAHVCDFDALMHFITSLSKKDW
jgi:hypothetical protein